MLNYVYRKAVVRLVKDTALTDRVITELNKGGEDLRKSITNLELKLKKAMKDQVPKEQLYKDMKKASEVWKNPRLPEREKTRDEGERQIKQIEDELAETKQSLDDATAVIQYLRKNKGQRDAKVDDLSLKKIAMKLWNYGCETNGLLSQQLNRSLPQEFWVSKSPCQKCSDMLIKAYSNRPEKCPESTGVPTGMVRIPHVVRISHVARIPQVGPALIEDKPCTVIHIAGVYDGNPAYLDALLENSFTFKPWDVYEEYDQWKGNFEVSSQYKSISNTSKYKRTSEKIKQAETRHTKTNVHV